MATTTSLMTAEEFLALPEDGIDRELIRGGMREYPMTTRGGPHCLVTTKLAMLLGLWVTHHPVPRGRLYTGEIRVRLLRDPDTIVGMDLAYISPEHAARTPPNSPWIDGPPTLAIEILSPSDTEEGKTEKIRLYLDSGVPLVWVVDPVFETVMVYRPDSPPESFNVRQELSAEPHLPGLRIDVAAIFEV